MRVQEDALGTRVCVRLDDVIGKPVHEGSLVSDSLCLSSGRQSASIGPTVSRSRVDERSTTPVSSLVISNERISEEGDLVDGDEVGVSRVQDDRQGRSSVSGGVPCASKAKLGSVCAKELLQFSDELVEDSVGSSGSRGCGQVATTETVSREEDLLRE